MSPNDISPWLAAIPADQIDVEGGGVVYWFGSRDNSRRQRVRIIESNDEIRFEATVATASVVDALDGDQDRACWRRNRATGLVGFRIDSRGRLVAEATAPSATLTPDEFAVYLRAVATEADRLELVLTGSDSQ